MGGREGITISTASHSLLKSRAKREGKKVSEVLAEVVDRAEITPGTLKVVRSLRPRRVSLTGEVARKLRSKIEAAGGEVTMDEVLDMLLQTAGAWPGRS